ncbi:MAG: enoyl-CoA hydratase/isomerase family protein, partial [Mycobacterium sp.]
ATLVGRGRALMLAGSGTILNAADALPLGLLDVVVPRESFEDEWRALAIKLASGAADEIKRVIAGVTPEEAISAFAKLWVHDDHWAAADEVMARVSKS